MKHFLGDDGSFEKKFLAEEPVVVVFFVAEQEIQVVVAQDALRQAVLDEPLDEGDHGGAIWATVGEVAHEDEPPPLGMGAVFPVAKTSQEAVEGVNLAVGIADDIDRAVEQLANEGTHGRFLGGRMLPGAL